MAATRKKPALPTRRPSKDKVHVLITENGGIPDIDPVTLDGGKALGRDWQNIDEMQSKLDFYLEAFHEVKQRVNSDQAASVIVQELAKDARMAQQRNHETGQSESATSNQIEYLKKLGVTIPIGLTKQRASGLIDSALAREDY